MIFEKLVLQNFGVYRGRHQIDLSPRGNKNVILIGALNGAGKTTLLDAIQLVMHGKLAACSSRGSSAYDEFLRRSIHRGVDPAEGAFVELEFSHRTAGIEQHVRVRRSWTASGRQARESLAVRVNDREDAALCESWAEHAETFLPSALAPLFLFDGEKIERLADPEHSASMLRTAVHSLLGLTLVDRLSADLAVLNRRKQERLEKSGQRDQLASVEAEIERTESARTEQITERASLLNQKTRSEKRLDVATTRYRQEGGAAFEKKASIEARIESIRSEICQTEERLREEAAANTPLLLVEDALRRIRIDGERGREIAHARIFADALEDRDESVISLLTTNKTPKKWIDKVDAFLSEDREKRRELAGAAPSVTLGEEAATALETLLSGGADSLRTEISSLISRYDGARSNLADLESALASVPQEEDIESLAEKVDQERDKTLALERELVQVEVRIEEANRSLSRLYEQRERLLRSNVQSKFADEDSQRVAAHAIRVQDTLDRFRTLLLSRNIQKLSTYVLESYRHLLRKDSLVDRIEIDPDSFSVALFSPSGDRLEADRLSAGERQLLATAILWGLARAAGHALPMVIDTPLGRLDSTHRKKLVERYFPHASHQVVLLSTDEEIDQRYFTKLKPHIARSYSLEFQDDLASTEVRSGYFPAEAKR